MTSLNETLVEVAAYGTPVVAGIALCVVLSIKEFRPSLASGFTGALLVGLVGGGTGGGGGSGMGADFGAVLGGVLIALYACAGFLLGIGFAACMSPAHRRLAAYPLLAGMFLPIVWTLCTS